MSITIVIPAYNEEKRLPVTLQELHKHLVNEKYDFEILVVDDGSTDNTVDIVREFANNKTNVRVIANTNNRGKGAVVKQGVLEANKNYILYSDADNATPNSEIGKLMTYIDQYPVVIGSRKKADSQIKVTQPLPRKVISYLANLFISLFLIEGYYDTQCGFKLFERRAAREIFALLSTEGFGFDFELLVIAKRLGYPVLEKGIQWHDRPDSRVRAGRAALQTLWELIRVKYRDVRGDYQRDKLPDHST